MGDEAEKSWRKFCEYLRKEEDHFISDSDTTHFKEVLIPTLKRGSWGPIFEIQVSNPAMRDRRGNSNLKRAINLSDNFKVSNERFRFSLKKNI